MAPPTDTHAPLHTRRHTHARTHADVKKAAFGNAASLFTEDFPLPKDWMAAASPTHHGPSVTNVGHYPGSYPYDPDHHHHHHGHHGHEGAPGHGRFLLTDDLPLPKTWSPAPGYGGVHDGHGSYPYTGEPGQYGNGGYPGDHGDGYPNAGTQKPQDKMADVPGAKNGETIKTHPVRSLETITFKKAKEGQQATFYLRGRRPSV